MAKETVDEIAQQDQDADAVKKDEEVNNEKEEEDEEGEEGEDEDEEDEEDEEDQGPRMPVTILTGFLGSGKSTLTKHILTAMHGKKFAVIENEFGEVGIDDALIKENVEGQIIEMLNGCICCTVRSDLAVVVKKLLARSDEFDAIIIETTGMADPAPVAQTFFADEEIAMKCELDGIITVVDAKFILTRLNEVKPEGVVNEAQEQLAFADRVLLNKIDLVDKEELEKIKKAIRGINSTAEIIETERSVVDPARLIGIRGFSLDRVLEFQPDFKDVDSDDDHSHHDDDSDDDDDDHHHHGKKHDKSISSVAFHFDGSVSQPKLEEWLQELLGDGAEDLLRYKGIVSIAGVPEKYVFQGVHQLLEGNFASEWKKDEKRESKLVFIGRNLDKKALSASFEACKALPTRFKVNDRVEFNVSKDKWYKGTVQATWADGFAYRILADEGQWENPAENKKMEEQSDLTGPRKCEKEECASDHESDEEDEDEDDEDPASGPLFVPYDHDDWIRALDESSEANGPEKKRSKVEEGAKAKDGK